MKLGNQGPKFTHFFYSRLKLKEGEKKWREETKWGKWKSIGMVIGQRGRRKCIYIRDEKNGHVAGSGDSI